MVEVESLIELNERANDGLTVTLLYDPTANKIYLHIVDVKCETDKVVEVPKEQASEAFDHPMLFV